MPLCFLVDRIVAMLVLIGAFTFYEYHCQRLDVILGDLKGLPTPNDPTLDRLLKSEAESRVKGLSKVSKKTSDLIRAGSCDRSEYVEE